MVGKRSDEIRNHQFISEVENSKELAKLLLEEQESAETVHYEDIKRIYFVLSHLLIIYKNTDPYMINPKKLTEFLNHNIINNSSYRLSNLHHYLEQYKLNKNATILNYATTIVDGLIAMSSYFIYPKTGREVAGLRAATEKYHKVVNEGITEIEFKLGEFETAYNEISSSVTEDIDKRDKETKEFKTEILEHKQTLEDTYEERIKSLTDTHQVQISEIKEGHKETLAEIEEEKGHLLSEITQELEKQKKSYEDIMEKHITEIEGLVGAVAERSISYGFQKIANEEKAAKEKWNNYTLISLVLLILFTLSMVGISFFVEFNWSTMLARIISGIGAFGAIIGFCGKQASNHVKAERENRKMELELASLNPYFAGYDKKELFEIKSRLADRFFGGNESLLNNKEDEDEE